MSHIKLVIILVLIILAGFLMYTYVPAIHDSIQGAVLSSNTQTYTSIFYPVSDGAYHSWIPSVASSTHYRMVREVVCDGNQTYNFASSTSQTDSYGLNLTSIPNGATIIRIDISPCAAPEQRIGSSTLYVFYRLNNTNSTLTTYTLQGTTTPIQLQAASYQNLNIPKGPSTVLEIGAGVIWQPGFTGNAGLHLSDMNATITYTVPIVNPSPSSTGSPSPSSTL